MASEVLCGRCGALLTNPIAACPRCGASASGAFSAEARPQASSQVTRSPLVAAALAIVPGLGHFYLGHTWKGVGYLIGIGVFGFFGLDLDLSVIGLAFGVPMDLSAGALWLYSIVDAYRTAKVMQGSGAAPSR